MSGNLEIVQAMYAAFGRGDVGFILDQLAPAVTWETVGDPAHGGHYGARLGRAGVADFFAKLAGENEFTDFAPEIFDTTPDKVFVQGRSAMTKRATGRSVSERWIMVFTFRDGKIVDFREWDNSAGHAAAG